MGSSSAFSSWIIDCLCHWDRSTCYRLLYVWQNVSPSPIDFVTFNRTFPPLNIALYNAFGGTGDELYGVEPPSYYVMNLILMLGPVTFAIALIGPVLILFAYPLNVTTNVIMRYKIFVFMVPAILWLSIMFSRPHKVGFRSNKGLIFLGREISVSNLSAPYHHCCSFINIVIKSL